MCLSAKALFGLLLDQQDAPAGIGKFRRGDQAGQACANHDDIGGLHNRMPLALSRTPNLSRARLFAYVRCAIAHDRWHGMTCGPCQRAVSR
ncbi:hypothetical protein GCM10027066_31520 [Dyella jejuensis]